MRNTDPDKMHLSSADEHQGIQPIHRAVDLVLMKLREDFMEREGRSPDAPELPTIYVVSFTYILGGWKASLSTSEANGHYYELTYNVAKRETYIDRYSKDYNECVPDPDRTVVEALGPAQPVIHITNPPPAPNSAALDALRQRIQERGTNRYLH
jgi:hypothetical protein